MRLDRVDDSSVVKGIGYDATSRVLTVQWVKRGNVTKYKDVPPEVFSDVMESQSIGSALHLLVRGSFETMRKEEMDQQEQDYYETDDGREVVEDVEYRPSSGLA